MTHLSSIVFHLIIFSFFFLLLQFLGKISMLQSDSGRKIQVDAQFTSAPLETISNFTSSKTISQVKYTNSQFSIHLLLQKQFQISQFHSLRFIGSKINFTIHCTGEELQVHEYLCCRYSVSCFSSFTHLFAFLIIEGTVCTTKLPALLFIG